MIGEKFEPNAGKLAATVLPEVIWKLFQNKANGVLTLSQGKTTKKVFLEDGHPFHVESSLLTDTLGEFLVREGLLTSDQQEEVFRQTVENGKPFPSVLLETRMIAAAKLYDHVGKNLVINTIGCFAWQEGAYVFDPEIVIPEGIIPVPMNPARLVIEGVRKVLPLDWVEGEKGVSPTQEFALAPSTYDFSTLQLGEEEFSLLQLLKRPQTAQGVAEKTGKGLEKVLREFLAFEILGLIKPFEGEREASLDELVADELLKKLRAKPQRETEQTKEIVDRLAGDYLHLMGVNLFELLGVGEDASKGEIRQKFLEFSIRYNPERFRKEECAPFRDRAEEIYLRGVKAFTLLSGTKTRQKYLERIQAQEKPKAVPQEPTPTEAETAVSKPRLGAEEQFLKGKELLKRKKYPKAVALFEHAREMDPNNASCLAHLGWAIFLKNPDTNVEEAETLLRRARDDHKNADAAFFLGKFLLANGQNDEALSHLRAATQFEPENVEWNAAFKEAEKWARGAEATSF